MATRDGKPTETAGRTRPKKAYDSLVAAIKQQSINHGMVNVSEDQRAIIDSLWAERRAEFSSVLRNPGEAQRGNEIAENVLNETVWDPTVMREIDRLAVQPSIEQDIESESLWEIDHERRRIPARPEIQQQFAPHDELDRRLDAADLPRLFPPEKLAVREELRQLLERELLSRNFSAADRPVPPSIVVPVYQKRGRPLKYGPALKECARQKIRDGGSWKDAAAVLTGKAYPTIADRKNAAKLLGPKRAIKGSAKKPPTE